MLNVGEKQVEIRNCERMERTEYKMVLSTVAEQVVRV